MAKIPYSTKSEETKHPLIKQYDSFFTNNSTFEDREELIFDFYNRNLDFVNDIDNINSNFMIAKLIEMKIIYVRILDGKQEYKKCEPICKQIKVLLSQLSKTYHKYDSLYLNGNKWVAINLGRRKKYLSSNKIFKELIQLDENKEFHIGWISGNYCRLISDYIVYPLFTIGAVVFIWNAIIQLFAKDYYWYIPKPYSVINSLLFFIAVLLYFNMNKPIRNLVERKYK